MSMKYEMKIFLVVCFFERSFTKKVLFHCFRSEKKNKIKHLALFSADGTNDEINKVMHEISVALYT